MAEANTVSAPLQGTGGSKSILLIVESPKPNQVITSSVILIQGFAVAGAQIDEIIVECAGIVQSANYGIYRPDLAKAYPNYPPLANSGFTCEIKREQFANLLGKNSGEGLPLKVTARDRRGQEQKVQSTLRLKPQLAEPLEPAALDPEADPAMVLQVDERKVDKRGLLRVHGWVLSHSPIKQVSVFIDSELIGSAELALARPDVAQAWPQFTSAANSGFLLVADATTYFPEGQQSNARQIRIVAQTVGGVSREAKFPLEVPDIITRRKPKDINQFFCDNIQLTKAGTLSLSGWTVSSLGIDKIRVDFEGVSLGFAEYGQDRPDVGNRFPAILQSRKSGFGFRADVDPAQIKGEHAVCIETIFRDGSSRRNNVFVAATDSGELQQTVVETVADEIQLNIDEPQIVDGKAMRLVEGTFAVNGWAIAKAGIASIDFELDGKGVGSAYYGVRREDVAKAFPTYGHDNALLSGFAFSIPNRVLTEGHHQVTFTVKAKSGGEKKVAFAIDVGAIGEQPGPWVLRDRLSGAEELLAERLVEHLGFRPKFYVCINCRRDNVEFLSRTLRSVATQFYSDWNILIFGDEKRVPAIEAIIHDEFATIASRIHYLPSRAEIAKLTARAKPRDLVLPLDAGDILAVDALLEFALTLNQNDKIDFLYADERRANVGANREDAFFKPDWSPTLLFSANYIGRPWCATIARIQKAGRAPFDDLTDNYDFILHLTEKAEQVAHVRRVLARRGDFNIESQEAETKALKKAVKRRRLPWSVEAGLVANTYRCRPKSKIDDLISIIIPTCGSRGLIKTCLDSLRKVSTYKNIEIICIENIADEDSEWKPWLRDNCDVVISIGEKFNWSLFNNVAAREASGSYLLFLNDDIEVIQPDWLEAMLDQARRDDVGVVGPQLLYPDRKVQHAGMFLAGGSIARHAFRFCASDDPGYFGLALTQRDVVSVTGACMLVKTKTFESVGGFDEAHSVTNNDLDFCLAMHERNLRCVYTPFATLIHHELASRKDLKDEHDASGFHARWGSLIAQGDPYFHPNLDRTNDIYQADPEPTEIIFAGHPLFRKQAIKKILAIKVDHIGDFITAFPAFRRLKSAFPDAELVALVAPASKQLAKLEPSIDRVIAFEFFHARSQLGKAEVNEKRLFELQRELAPFHFDLAIDLRKQPDTRMLLKYSGARLTAGFDQHNKFPWLDVAGMFEGDVQLAQKRQHVSADLLNLIDVVAGAGEQDRGLIKRPDDWSSHQKPILARVSKSGLYKKPVVCIHPATGNETKQWPPVYFADVINALLTTEDLHFAIIGGPDESPIADEILKSVSQPTRVFNFVGKLRLEELSYFLDTCSLFVGNDSGPKHIAAGIGVPTIGIHSGVVDAREWGPQGDLSVTVRRNMSCSPCYYDKPELCHRGLACLRGLHPAPIVSMCRTLLKLERGPQIK